LFVILLQRNLLEVRLLAIRQSGPDLGRYASSNVEDLIFDGQDVRLPRQARCL